MDGVILFSHGSLLCGSGQALEEHARRIREEGSWSAVEIGYLNYSRPTFTEAAARLAAIGVRRITVVPYFLVPGKFVTSDLPNGIARARAEHPALEFTVAEPIGFHEGLVEAILELAGRARGPEEWRMDLARAAAQCEERPECPLFGTVRCPRTLSRPMAAIR